MDHIGDIIDIDNIPIDIGIATIINSEYLSYICMSNLISMAKNPSRLRFYLCVDLNKSTDTSSIHVNQIKKLVPNIVISTITTGLQRSSISHGMTLNYLYTQFTNRYFLLTDNDTLILHKNWDSLFLHTLINSNSIIMGIPYTETSRYANFPCVRFCLFDREKLLPLDIDFRPKFSIPISDLIASSDRALIKNNCLHTIPITQQNHKLYQSPIGTSIICDTGFDLINKIKTNNLNYIVLTYKNNKFYYGDIPMISHLELSSKIRKTDPRINAWLKNSNVDISNNIKIAMDPSFN